MMEPLTNDAASLCFHRSSLRQTCIDYKITFAESHTSPQMVVDAVRDLVYRLSQTFPNKMLIARMIALVDFTHFNDITNEVSERSHYFTAYRSEQVTNVDDFVSRNLAKIAQRIDVFHERGSYLMIRKIAGIYLQVLVSSH